MDVLSLIGIILAFVAIIGGNFLEGGHLGALANGPAALIVLGGTFGAALLQSPMSAFKRAIQILAWILFPPRIDLAGGVDLNIENLIQELGLDETGPLPDDITLLLVQKVD